MRQVLFLKRFKCGSAIVVEVLRRLIGVERYHLKPQGRDTGEDDCASCIAVKEYPNHDRLEVRRQSWILITNDLCCKFDEILEPVQCVECVQEVARDIFA